MAGDVRTILHKIHVEGPKGQYFVKTPNNVMGIVSRHRAESPTASVAMKMFRAVLMPEKQKYTNLGDERTILDQFCTKSIWKVQKASILSKTPTMSWA